MHYAALDHHLAGDDASALRELRCIFRQSDFLDEKPAFLVTRMVGIGVGALGSHALMRFASDLKVVANDNAEPLTGPATTAQVRAMIAQLLDDGAYRKTTSLAWHGERVMAVDDTLPLYLVSMTGPVSPWQRAAIWPTGPMFQLDALRIFRSESAIANASAEPTFPAARARMPPMPRAASPSPLRRMTTLLHNILMPSFARVTEVHFRGLTERRIAAVLLAIRLYQLDHGGAAAPDLPALVPGYLPAVPVDPFSPQAAPLRYIATPGSEMVYSVGTNGVDDGATTRPSTKTTSNRQLTTWEMMDAVVPFHPPPPLPPPATQPDEP